MNMTKKYYTKPEAEKLVFFTAEDIAELPLSDNVGLSDPFYGEEVPLEV